MGRRHSDDQPIGDDSFMDTIANLIGILIILIVIVGARSQTSAKDLVAKEIEEQWKQVATPLATSKRIESDILDQAAQLARYERELAHRSMERMLTNDRVNIAKNELDKQLSALDEESKEEIETDIELSDLQKQLADLLNQEGEFPDSEVPPAILQHLPTPMAKTVFGHEIHVLLTGKTFSVIPWNDLLEALKREARTTASRNTLKNQITGTLGPIGGFTMKYALKGQSGVMSDGTESRLGRMVELDKFVVLPTDEVLRESLEETLAPGGRLRSELTLFRDKNATVTVWVYPDSFQEFRGIKERLFHDGYLCAARPLPFGVPIGASPNGLSTVAQ